jgi:hypothetical protein
LSVSENLGIRTKKRRLNPESIWRVGHVLWSKELRRELDRGCKKKDTLRQAKTGDPMVFEIPV